ncbi:MAG: Gfo/Idh/MocA family oxidoreductase [Pedosphaera sp.]|nr:Gfo/Idh/MocA family oxidoreductase [Pedosphaera sp.]
MKRTTPLRMGVIGCGAIGTLHANAIRQSNLATLLAVCDTDFAKAETLGMAGSKAQAFSSFEKMLADTPLDAVTVATPDRLHLQPVLAAIRQGLHVFCEKPLAGTAAEAARLVRAARTGGVQLGVDYNRRFAFGYQKAKQLLDAGCAGSVCQVAFHVCDGVPAKVASQPHALLTSLLSHHIDLLRFLCGEIISVQALFHGPSRNRPHDVSLIAQFASGAVGSITAGWRNGQARTVEHLRLAGTQGVVIVDDVQHAVTLWHATPDDAQRFQPDYFAGGNRFYDSVTAHVAAFIAALSAGKTVPVTAEDGWAGLRLIEAAIESNRTGRRTKLSP